MNKATAKSIETARTHAKLGNDGAYARIIAALYRAASNKVQLEIVIELDKDNKNDLFYFQGDCLMAKE